MTKQIIKFGLVGILCFVIDFGLFALTAGSLGYLAANIIAFTTATVVNYSLSAKYVFDSRGRSSPVAFFMLCLVGLGLSNSIIEYLAPITSANIAKICSVVIVMLYNFITRKILFESSIVRLHKTNILKPNLLGEREGTAWTQQ